MSQPKPALIQHIEQRLDTPLHPAPAHGYDPVSNVARAHLNRDSKTERWLCQYALHEDGALAGLNLMGLDLTDAQWADIAQRSGTDWGRIEALNLSRNKLTAIPELAQMTALRYADLTENDLREVELPASAEHVFLFGNERLGTPPPEIVKQGRMAIHEYFRQQATSGSEPLLEAKLILLGDGRAGKTTLANRLMGKPAPTEADRTQGVDIIIGAYQFPVANGGTFTLNIWDFAGQDKYKPLHQFFYTESSLYVMVADSGNAQTDYDDWLQTAELFGEGSPLILVLNEFREGIGMGTFDEDHWRKRFPALLNKSLLVNLLQGKNCTDLIHHIQLLAQSLPHTRYTFPKNWAAIRRVLESRREENFITYEEYLRVCRDNQLPEEKSADILLEILHKVGVCLHYKNELLRQYVILKNEWATQAVYKILEDRIIAEEKRGFFDRDDLARIWREGSYARMRPQLLELMMQFKMAYRLPNDREFVTPPMLLPAPPEDWSWPASDDDTELYVEYEFLPKALLTQFIVTRHADIALNRTLVWRNGVVLRWPDAQAEVSKTKSQGRDAFWVRVQGHNRRGMLTSIVQTFRALHSEYKGIKAFEMVPCPCSGCKSGQNRQHYFDFESLSNRLSKRRSTIECDKSLEVLDVRQFLENRFVFDPIKSGEPLRLRVETGSFDTGSSNVKTGTSQPQALRAFFSYSKHDIAHLKDFQKHLKSLERQGLIEFWDDRLIRPGEEWNGEIKEALMQSDLIFLLVTADFIATDYVWDIEIREAMRRHRAKTARVIPIKVSSCEWAGMPFAELQGLPRKDQIIDLAANKAAVWAEVVHEIKSILMVR